MSYQGPDRYYDGGPRLDEPSGIRVRNGVDVGGFFGILSRQKIWILIGFVITFGLAFFYIFSSGLTYTSTISILIDARDRPPIGSDQSPLPQQADPVMVESQLKLMTSSAVLKRVVIAENLESDPDFAPSDRVGVVGGLMNLIMRGKVSAPPMDQIIDNLSQRITVKRPERTYVVDLDVKASSPGKAARLANAIAKAFIDEERAAADAYVQEQSDWVIKRTKQLRDKLEAAEKRVQDYKAQNGIVDVQGTLTQEQQLQDANRDLVAARTKAGEAQARYDQVKKIMASGRTLDGTYDAINSTVIRQLRIQYADLVRRQAALSQKYGERHPEYIDIVGQVSAVRRQIDDEMQRIASALQNEALVSHDAAEAAQRRAMVLEQKTTATNEVSLQLKEFQRLADGERTNYEKFLRANDSIRRDPTETPYARIVAPASYPASPSSPKVMAALLIAASAGLSLGIGLAVFMDRGPAVPDYPVPEYPERAPLVPPPSAPRTPPRTPQPPTSGPIPPPPPPPSRSTEGLRDEPTAPPQTVEPQPPQPAPGANPFALLADEERRVRTEPVSLSSLFRLKSPQAKRRPLAAPPAAPLAVSRAEAIDPRDLLLGLARDLEAGHDRRVVITGRELDMQKTDLTLTIARGLAARGHAVLVIDGDNTLAALSQLARRDGVAARIPVDGVEVQVLGLPTPGEGVVFVLPQPSAIRDLGGAEAPRLDVRVRAVIVEAPHEGADLTRFRALADVLYLVDTGGHLRMLDLAAKPREAATRKRA